MNINEQINWLVNGDLPPIDFGAWQDLFVFDWYSLASINTNWMPGLWNMVLKINDLDLMDVDLKTFVSWLSDGQRVLNKRYDSKNLNVQMAIFWTSHADLRARIDEFKKYTQVEEWDFEINYDWDVRVWKGTIRNIIVEELKIWSTIAMITFDVFLSTIWKSKVLESRKRNNLNANSIFVIDNEWSYETPPKVIILFWAAWNVWVFGVLLRNKKLWDTNGYEVSYTGPLTNGDTLIFDFDEIDVSLNWVWDQDFDWPMKPLAIWKTSFEIEITATSVNYSIYIVYNKRWI
jgi:hypothetical protein